MAFRAFVFNYQRITAEIEKALLLGATDATNFNYAPSTGAPTIH